jgi:hypothetical protein
MSTDRKSTTEHTEITETPALAEAKAGVILLSVLSVPSVVGS